MKNEYPYIGRNPYYTVIFLSEDYGKCIESSFPTVMQLGYEGFCLEDTFNPIKEIGNMKKLKSGDIIVGSQLKSNDAVSIAVNPHVHTNLKEADVEAERLAKQFPDKRFLVLEVKVAIETTTIVRS